MNLCWNHRFTDPSKQKLFKILVSDDVSGDGEESGEEEVLVCYVCHELKRHRCKHCNTFAGAHTPAPNAAALRYQYASRKHATIICSSSATKSRSQQHKNGNANVKEVRQYKNPVNKRL